MRPCLRWLVASLAVLLQGCLLYIPPSWDAIDATWQQRMLAGEYGQWLAGEKTQSVRELQ